MKITVILFLLITSISLKAQDEEVKLKLRHIKGIRGVDVGYGVSKYGTYYSVGYVHFLTNIYLLNPSIKYETGKIGLTELDEYSFFLSFQRILYKSGDAFFVNVGIAPCIQAQQTNNEVLNMKETFFPFGASLDINMEFYILNNLVLRGDFSEVYSYNDKFGSFRYLAGGGLRIYF